MSSHPHPASRNAAFAASSDAGDGRPPRRRTNGTAAARGRPPRQGAAAPNQQKWYLADSSDDERRADGRPLQQSQQPQQQRRRYQPKQQHPDGRRARPSPAAGADGPRVRPPRPSPRHLEINRELLACGADAGALLAYADAVKDEMNFFNFATCFNRCALMLGLSINYARPCGFYLTTMTNQQ